MVHTPVLFPTFPTLHKCPQHSRKAPYRERLRDVLGSVRDQKQRLDTGPKEGTKDGPMVSDLRWPRP